ncbi:hypothetical protein [Anaerobaca lacustris]|uniref:Uncharacterized protein n=1 Tax=Anaerobaca lacustris TaxID=3044600 RepID=A0AAW6TYF0_9BACT|nr:hypothetical protein [Sedimentisphaerales bacterium M17dextr]
MKMKKCAVVGLALASIIGAFLWQFFKEDHGVGVDSVSWLPREARNITYIRNDAIKVAEFDVEREAFRRWCARQEMPLRELRDGEEHTILRCRLILEERGVLLSARDPNKGENDLHSMQQGSKKLGVGDLFYEERWSNGGGYSIGYDVRSGRGYYYHSRH